MKHRRILKITAVLAALLILLVAAGMIYISHANRQSAIVAATTWARLAPLPAAARNVEVQIKGSMFTREFVITFDAPPAAIRQWLAASPGPSSAIPGRAGPLTTYAIQPGGGAQFAEVKVDTNAGKVIIHACWS